MSESFTERPCDHCGRLIESHSSLERIGDNSVHRRCLDKFVDVTPKIDLAPHTCEVCYKSYYTQKGYGRHVEKHHA